MVEKTNNYTAARAMHRRALFDGHKSRENVRGCALLGRSVGTLPGDGSRFLICQFFILQLQATLAPQAASGGGTTRRAMLIPLQLAHFIITIIIIIAPL